MMEIEKRRCGSSTRRWLEALPCFRPLPPFHAARSFEIAIASLSFFFWIAARGLSLYMASEIVRTSAEEGKRKDKSPRAYVTFLAGDGDYVKGAVGLAKGLKKVDSAYPLVVAALPDVPESHRQILVSQGCIIRDIEPVYPPENQTEFAKAYYAINYSKLRIWEFVEYQKIVYLDADIQVYENVDHLFDLPDGYFYAVMDCFCEKTWSHTPQFEIGYCQQCPDRVTWPAGELSPPPSLYFNAGMFVHEPCLTTCESLLAAVKIVAPSPFAEQDFLNMFFKDIYKPIPLVYNLIISMLWRHPEKVDLEKVKLVHYCNAWSKPWRYTGKEANMDREDIKMLVGKWWNVYNDESLDYKGLPFALKEGEVRELPVSTLSAARAVEYVMTPSVA